MKSTLKETMKDYDGIKGTSVSALGWNWLQQEVFFYKKIISYIKIQKSEPKKQN